MLTKVEIRPVTGTSLELNSSAGAYPLSKFDIIGETDNPSGSKKMAAPGEWKKHHLIGAQTIIAEGKILGNGANDTARSLSYITQRLALLDAIMPPMDDNLTARHHGVLRVRMDGMTEDADAEVVCTQRAVPLAAMEGARSEFFITWKAFLPYFIGQTSGTKYILG